MATPPSLNCKVNEDLKPLVKPIGQVYENPQNPRVHGDRQVASIAASLNEFGQQKPCVAINDGDKLILVAGHGIYQTAHSLGWEGLAVLTFDKDVVRAKAFMEADNRLGMMSSWDHEKHSALLAELRTDVEDWEKGLDTIGYTPEEIDLLADPWAQQEPGEQPTYSPDDETFIIKVGPVSASHKEIVLGAVTDAIKQFGYEAKAY